MQSGRIEGLSVIWDGVVPEFQLAEMDELYSYTRVKEAVVDLKRQHNIRTVQSSDKFLQPFIRHYQRFNT